MTWAALVPLIVQYGLPVAEAIWKKWASGTPPTAADFEELRVLAKQTATDRMKAMLVQNGIPLDSPEAQTLLALTF